MSIMKYSRQREAIKEYLLHTAEHPTADTVYMHVKEEFPNISLGTVYRNLNLLSDMGEIIKISSADGGDRFDGDTSPHYHFFCSSCGRVMDLNVDAIDHVNAIASKGFDGTIEFHQTSFYGKCGKCLANSRSDAKNIDSTDG